MSATASPTAGTAAGPVDRPQAPSAGGKLVDGLLVALLAALPLLAPTGRRQDVIVLIGVAGAGFWALYQKASRTQRLSRCAWTAFLATAVSIHLSAQASGPGAPGGGIPAMAAQAGRWAALLACAVRLSMAAIARRAPGLTDSYDWAAALCLCVFAVTAGAFASAGELRGGLALAEPAAIAAMFLVVRGQCAGFARARRLAQIATAAAVLSLVVWGVTR